MSRLVVRSGDERIAAFIRYVQKFFDLPERWDGAGYPHGLAGERIPLVSRVLAIADAYDAMLADRPYRNAMTVQQASKELEAGAGTQFDPVLVEAFLRRGIGHSAQLRSQHTGSPLSLAA